MLVGLGKYTKANVTEGLQEQYQEGVSDAFTRYYEDLYFDPSHVSSKLPYLSTGLARQFTTAQGWETFASGFMMGGLMQGPQYLAFTKGKDLVQSTFKKEKYNAAKAQEKDMVANMVTALNETDDFIKRYSKGEDLNSAVQIRNAKHLANATVSGNKKAYIDIVDDSLANHFYTLAASGKMSVMKDQIKDYQNMSPEEQMQAFGIGDAKANPAKIAERLSHMAKLAEDIEERYKVVDEEYVNPFNPLRYDPKTEMVAYMKELENKQAFEEAKKWAVTSSYQYDNTVKRLQSIYAKASNTPVEGALANDFQILYNTDKAMDKEYKTLVSEIDSFEGATGLSKNDRSDLNFKKRKVKYLDAYINAKAFYTDAMQSGDKERIEKAIPDLYKAYVKYTHVIAENVGSPVFDRKTLSTFMNILDFYKLGEEKAHLAHAVNFLNNPEGIGYMTSRISKILSNINNKRQVELEKALLAFKDQAKLNKILNRLLDIGLFIDKPEMTDLLEGRPVTKFYQVGAEHVELPAASDKYPQAIDIVTDYRLEKGFITAEEIETHNAKVAEEHVKTQAPETVVEPVTAEVITPAPAATVDTKAEIEKQRNMRLQTAGEAADAAGMSRDELMDILDEINAEYDAKLAALEGKKTQGISEDDFKALRKKGFTEKVINSLTPAEVDEIFKSFADNALDDITQTEILKRRKEVEDAQKAAEKKAKSKSYEKLTADLVAEATALQNKEQYAEFMNKIKDYKTDSYDMAAVDSILAPKRKEYGDAEYAKKKVTYDQIKDGDLVYLPETGTSKMYVVIKLEKTNSFKLYLKGANPKTATTEYPAEDVPKRILQVANMKETKIEPVTAEAKEAANENITTNATVSKEDKRKVFERDKDKDPDDLLNNLANNDKCGS